jgi:hypothetical protein
MKTSTLIPRLIFPIIIGVVSSSSVAFAKTWNENMAAMAKSFSLIMPYVFDEKAFSDPTNTPLIKKEVETLRSISIELKEQVTQHGGAKDQNGNDPSLEYMANAFGSQLDLVLESINAGQLNYARMALRPALSYCISCHTRTSQGPAFKISPFQTTIDTLKPLDRIAVYAATRQYEPALKEFGSALRDAHGNGYQIDQATRLALAVSVRVKQSPEDAIRVLDQAATAPGLVKSSEIQLHVWRKSVIAWMAEKDKSDFSLEKAKALIKTAEAAKEYPADGSGDIRYLRATAILHALLRDSPEGQKRAETEFALGKCYEALRDLGFWDLHEVYFAACVKDAPHTALAKRCFAKYDESVAMSYTGTAGTFVPTSVDRTLKYLRTLSEPEKKEKKK